MAKKATELSDLHIRRLKHHVTASGEPRAKRYPVGGVSGLYIQCSPPSGSNRVGSKQWILRTLGVSNPCCRDENPEKGPQEKDQQGNHYQLSHNSSPELEFFPN